MNSYTVVLLKARLKHLFGKHTYIGVTDSHTDANGDHTITTYLECLLCEHRTEPEIVECTPKEEWEEHLSKINEEFAAAEELGWEFLDIVNRKHLDADGNLKPKD